MRGYGGLTEDYQPIEVGGAARGSEHLFDNSTPSDALISSKPCSERPAAPSTAIGW
jgi:hypothetical protein